MHAAFMFRIIGILLLLGTGSLKGGEPTDRLPLHGGCLATTTQYLLKSQVACELNLKQKHRYLFYF
jgi:hypothetical protein